ncbi:MAG: ATP-binding protein [Myxococcota bacterium]
MCAGKHAWWRTPAVAVADYATAVLLHWVSLMVGVLTVLVAAGTVATLGFELQHITANLLVIVMCGVTQVLLRRGQARRVAQVFVFVIWAVISVWLFLLGGTASPLLVTYFPVIATTSVLLSRRMGLVYAGLSCLVVGALFLAEANGYHPSSPYTPPLRFVVTVAALGMTGGIIYLAAKLREDTFARAQASEHQFEELVRTAPEAILTVDDQGVVRGNNPAAQTLFQQGSNLVGRRLASLPGLETLPAGPGGPLFCAITRPDGTRREVEVDVRPLPVQGRPGTRVSVRDVTAQRQAEQDRARLTEQLHQVQKQESIGLLAGGIAHDFNNLISVILSDLALLKPALRDDEARVLVAEMEDATLRAANLTRQLLAFSRRQVLHARNLSVSEVVEGLQPMLRRLLTENIELTCRLDAKGIVRADAGQLEQVIVNLVVNARDAMPRGGALRVTTEDLSHGLDGAPGRHVCLRVEDTGEGMSAQVLARAFEPFFTTKEPGRGTGLGLSVVDGIVKQSGGVVRVSSTEGKGTTVAVCFPCVEASHPDVAVAPPAVEGNASGRTVLVVEDEPALRKVVVRVLEAAGFAVLAAPDGEEALRVVAGRLSTIDVVVTDVVMPHLGGPEVVKRLRAERPTLRALFMSGYSDRPLEELGAAAPHSAFLGKPFRPQELVTATLALLARP